MPENFISFCDSLWKGPLETSAFVGRTFCLEAAPEPYVSFEVGRAGREPLVFLTTNPGEPMEWQRREKIEAKLRLRSPNTYAEAAKALGAFYPEELAGKPAGHRIAAMRCLSKLVGADGFLQVEAYPFHSKSLPNKARLLRETVTDDFLARYHTHLFEFLSDKPVVAMSAVSSRNSLEPLMRWAEWPSWLARLVGLDLESARFERLVPEQGPKSTAAAFISRQEGERKALVLMMGGNHLPGPRGRQRLADALQGWFGRSR